MATIRGFIEKTLMLRTNIPVEDKQAPMSANDTNSPESIIAESAYIQTAKQPDGDVVAALDIIRNDIAERYTCAEKPEIYEAIKTIASLNAKPDGYSVGSEKVQIEPIADVKEVGEDEAMNIMGLAHETESLHDPKSGVTLDMAPMFGTEQQIRCWKAAFKALRAAGIQLTRKI